MTDPKRSRPTANRTASESLAGDTSRVQPIDRPDVSTRRRYWARTFIDRGTAERPMYGSTAWLALPDDHPDKVAACVVAAESWASIADDLEADLKREIEALRIGHKRAEDEEYQRQAAEHRERNERRIVSNFQLRRAAQLADVEPRPEDHPGGPGKPWNGGAA